MIDQTYDCEPTLTDQQVIEFCQKGFIILEAVVPDEVNRRVSDFLDEHTHLEPVEILAEDWFVEGCPQKPAGGGCGAVASGKKLQATDDYEQPPCRVPQDSELWLASGRRCYRRNTARIFTGVLLPPRHTERDGTDRIGAKLTLSPRQTPLHESLRQYPKGRENGGTGGLNFYHALQYLAPRHLLHR